MRTLAASWLLTLVCASLAHAQKFPFRDKYDYEFNNEKGVVTIEMADTTLRQNDGGAVRYTLDVPSLGFHVVNWQFNRLKPPLPGQLAIYDKNKKYLGDLLAWQGGSQMGVNASDWTFLYPGARVGTALAFRAGYVPSGLAEDPLPPGTYYLQLILYRAFVWSNPPESEGEVGDFYENFDRTELCRSNAIKITLLEEKFPYNTLEERKLADLDDEDWRYDALEWLGEHKVKKATPLIAAYIDKALASKEKGSLFQQADAREMSRNASTLGQIGDRDGLGVVRRVCRRIEEGLTERVRMQHPIGSYDVETLFQAHEARNLLGDNKDSAAQLERMYHQFVKHMEPEAREEFQKRAKTIGKPDRNRGR